VFGTAVEMTLDTHFFKAAILSFLFSQQMGH
jgi:hypothetical protein